EPRVWQRPSGRLCGGFVALAADALGLEVDLAGADDLGAFHAVFGRLEGVRGDLDVGDERGHAAGEQLGGFPGDDLGVVAEGDREGGGLEADGVGDLDDRLVLAKRLLRCPEEALAALRVLHDEHRLHAGFTTGAFQPPGRARRCGAVRSSIKRSVRVLSIAYWAG